jgi:AraC family transcriptional activator of tynA and feaB
MAQLEQVWSTGQTLPGNALSYWKGVVCDNLLEMQIDSSNEAGFFGRMEKYSLGPLKANFISVSEQRVWRTRSLFRAAREGVFHLIHVRKGVQLVAQHDRNVTLEAGSCLLFDCLSSFDFKFPEGVEALVLEIGRDWIRGWLPSPEEAAAQVIDVKVGWGATLSSALGNLTPSSIAALEMAHSTIAEQIAVLLALAVGPGGPSLTTHTRGLLRRVSDTIRNRCHEPELDPASVASFLGLSRRYIHTLLASADTTFSRELYKCRLQRSQRLLGDRRFDGISIAEVAWNCGFTEPSHFTRRFREHFGMAPTRYRCSVA